MLFVIDDSGSMVEEQRALREQIPRVVGVLASGDLEWDRPDAGGRDFVPPASLRFGVITPDMGTGGFGQATCDEPLFGGDGILRSRGNEARDPTLTCRPMYDRFLSFENPGGDRCAVDRAACEQVVDALECVAAVGTEGCGFEQQLEAMLKAVMPNTPTCTEPYCNFFMGTRGHGADPRTNGGFLGPRSVLAVVHVTDEDDCSAQDLDLFNSRSSRYFGNLNVRCNDFPSALHGADRYADGLLSVVPASRLVYSLVAGVPSPLLEASRDAEGRVDYDALLVDPALVPRNDASNSGVVPACVSSNGEAAPPRRLVEVGRALEARGAATTVASICRADFTPAIDAILGRLAERLAGSCVRRALSRDAAGFVPCRLREVLPAGRSCRDVPGRRAVGEERGRAVCRVTQRPPESASPGWFYDDGPEARDRCASAPGRLSFTDGAEPPIGAALRLECAL